MTTAIASKFVSPAFTAANAAVRSAQTVRPYDAFSTFAPLWTLFRFVLIAAPTLYFEYGAYARWRASEATRISSSSPGPISLAGAGTYAGSALGCRRVTRTRRMRLPSIVSTTKRAPAASNDSPWRGKRPSCAVTKPPSVS